MLTSDEVASSIFDEDDDDRFYGEWRFLTFEWSMMNMLGKLLIMIVNSVRIGDGDVSRMKFEAASNERLSDDVKSKLSEFRFYARACASNVDDVDVDVVDVDSSLMLHSSPMRNGL